MTIFRVSNQNQLETAVKNVQGGDTILLSSGKYTELKMDTGWSKSFKFSEKVTIKSANENDPAEINQMFLRKVKNVEISDINFTNNGKNAAGTESFRSDAPYFIEKGENVSIETSNFTGNRVGGFGTGIGLRVKTSSDVVVADSSFDGFFNAMNFSNTDGLTVARNFVTGMAKDGMTFGGVSEVLISNNEFRDFKSPNPDSPHKDNIQFRVGPTELASKDVIIRGNYIDSAEVRHGIYMGNELASQGIREGATYENILIEGNYIRSAQTHGITVFQGNGVYIRNNTVEQNSDLGFNTEVRMAPRINVSKYSDNVYIVGNDVKATSDPANPSWTVRDNIVSEDGRYLWDGSEYSRYTASVFGDIPRAPANPPAFSDIDRPDRSGKMNVISIAWDGAGDELRFHGILLDGGTRAVIANLDIPGDEALILNGFGMGTFRNEPDRNGFQTWDSGQGARIDSMMDFHEIDAYSKNVDITTRGKDLVMQIDYFRGVGEIVLKGLAAAYLAADPNDWY